MIDNLNKLMEHIDYFYEYVPSTYESGKKFEVYLKEGTWLITDKKTEESFSTTKHEEALNHLVKCQADLGLFHTMVFGKICTEGVLRRRQLKDVEELVGTDAINKQEEGWDNFADGLKDMIEAISVNREKSPENTIELTLVKDE